MMSIRLAKQYVSSKLVVNNNQESLLTYTIRPLKG